MGDNGTGPWSAYFDEIRAAADDGLKLVEWLDTCPIPELTPEIASLVARSYRNRFIRAVK